MNYYYYLVRDYKFIIFYLTIKKLVYKACNTSFATFEYYSSIEFNLKKLKTLNLLRSLKVIVS